VTALAPILDAPVLEGDAQSLSGTEVDIPGVGKVTFAPSSASDFPNMNMSQAEMCVMLWDQEYRLQALEQRMREK